MSPFQDSLPSALNPVINSVSVRSGLLGGEEVGCLGPAAVADCYRSDGQAASPTVEPRVPHSTSCDKHNGREREKGAELLWCAAETNTALCINQTETK